MSSEGRADYPCMWCGAPLDECGGPERRCCELDDHPWPTIAQTLTNLHDDLDTAHALIDEHAAQRALAAQPATGEGLDVLNRLYEQIDAYREKEANRGKPVRPAWFLVVVELIAQNRATLQPASEANR